MDFKIGERYVLVISVETNDGTKKTLTFQATILSESDNFVEFEDKNGNKYGYNKNTVMNYRRVE